MDVIALCPLPVGVVFWRAPQRVMTVVVKATYALDRDGEARLAEHQAPLWLDRPSAHADADELEQASDFAPLKRRAEVLLVGHARASSPSTAIWARVAVASFDTHATSAFVKRFVAVETEPAVSIPLVSRCLRTPEGGPERVGPLAPWSSERAAIARAGGIGPDGLPAIAATGVAFDFYNAAPRDQQLDAIAADSVITLEGLVEGHGRRRVRLPGAQPRVICARQGVPTEVALRCDTLWIDTDRQCCALTWRGAIVIERPEDAPLQLIVALEPKGAALSWEGVFCELARGERRRAVEASDLADRAAIEELIEPAQEDEEEEEEEPPTPRPRPPSGEASSGEARRGTWDGDETTNVYATRPQAPARPVMRMQLSSSPMSSARLVLGRAAPPAPKPAATAPEDEGSDARRMDETVSDLVVEGPPKAVTLPFVSTRGSEPVHEEVTATLDLASMRREASSALPFQSPLQSEVIAPAMDVAMPAAPPPEPTVGMLAVAAHETPAGDTAPPPAIEAPVEVLPLERYARIKAEIWKGGASLDQVLDRNDMTETAWRAHERRQAEAIEREAGEGRCDRALALTQALKAARAEL